MLLSRHANAWYLSGYAEAPVGSVRLRFPAGAPIFHATYARLEDGASLYPLARAMHHECRVFVDQERGVIGCDPRARDPGHQTLMLRLTGLEDATVTFLPPKGVSVSFESETGTVRFDPDAARCVQSRLSGELRIRW
jgi:hypothetical protein